MTQLPAYLEPLEIFSIPFPKAALEEALLRKDESVPVLLEVLETLPERMRKGQIHADYILHDYAMHILAELGETVAYRPLIAIARLPEIDDLISDGVTEDLPRVLAAVWDGDCDPLFDLIGDPLADEFARGAGMQALGILQHSGRLTRDALFGAALHLYENCLERSYSHIWDAWIMLVSKFGLNEFREHVSKLYRRGLADPGFQTERGALKAIEAAKPDADALERCYRAYTSAIEEMSNWVCFSDREVQREIRSMAASRNSDTAPNSDEDDDYYDPPEGAYGLPKTYIRENPKVGRNDPCPCGSGKKFKKCCLT